MASDDIAFERVPGHPHVVKLVIKDSKDSQSIAQSLESSFDLCLENGDRHFLIDFSDVEYPTGTLIALLVEFTSKARRLQGDVKIINITTSARNNFATFSPISYLSLEADEAYALRDFQPIEAKTPVPAHTVNDVQPDRADDKAKTSVKRKVKPKLTSVDIVEDPLIAKLQSSVVGKGKTAKADVREKRHLRVKSEAKNLYSICDFVTGDAEKAGFSNKDVGKTKIAVYEACLNVIEHAYHSNPDNWIDVWVSYNKKQLKVEIKDYGHAFEGFSNKKYNVMTAMDGRQTGGFGLYIIRRSMDELEYHPDKINGNVLTMVKYIPAK
jgi:anti-sigma regulatory factor (Ser/Thr protein kinase)